jgi:hypothetical protein
MIQKILALTFATCTIVLAQNLSPADYPKYAGYYVFDIKHGDQFKDFHQFELHVSTSNDSIPRLTGRVIFFSDTTLTSVDTTCVASIRRLYITKDSLFFQSEECFGETYEFQGRFLGIPSESGGRDDPILEGIFTHCMNQKIIKRLLVKFLWSAGC